MRRPLVLAVLLLVVLGGLGLWWVRRDHGPQRYTGFVEGEERIVRSEVTGRVLEVPYGEGMTVPPDDVVARLDDADIAARLAAKRHELDVLDADIRTQTDRVGLVERTWERDVGARRAELREAEAAATLAERNFTREQELVRTGASTTQLLDDAQTRREQARSARERARALLARAEAQEASIAVARHTLDSLREKHALTLAQLAELEITKGKYVVRAPGVATVVQSQLIWPGELAQPGAPVVAVLDPADKYVQVYVPVPDVDEFRLGRRVEIELDSEPGRRIPGEISFVADQANFTPEKIETRSDRLGQVYRAKVRVLEGAARLKPGTEGNVYLLGTRDGSEEERRADR
jgi:HlyD family secretion protein